MPLATYRPRDTPGTVLSTLLRDHLDDFLEGVNTPERAGLPVFVERQLRAMVACGDVTQGFARFACRSCRGSRIVALSCKTRLCPSCAGRRMAEQAYHLVDRVLPPRLPYRQWVLTLPWELARAVAYDADLCSRVFAIFADEVARWQCTRADAHELAGARAGAILEIQRFADALQLFVHGHLLAPDGVFYETADGEVCWRGVGPPTEASLRQIVTRVTERVARLLARRAGRVLDEPAEESGVELLAQCGDARPCGRVDMEGASASARGPRRRKPLCVRSPEGLEIHAAVHVTAADRTGLERLCKYLARPPIAEDRLTRLPDGRIEVRLKRPRGSTRALVFEPHAFIARMAALIPLPMTNLRRAYGVFSSAHRWRARIVPRPPDPTQAGKPVAPKRPARMSWASLLARTWGIDGLRCGACAGRLYFVSCVFAPTAVQAIVASIQLADARAAERRQGTAQQRGPPGLARLAT